ncbi:MAG: CBS domain-containing protein [Candidatus Limnocylindrales bacterium]
MICPACGFDNIAGEDECERCGTPLTGSERLSPQTRFEARLSGLASHSPLMVPRDTPISEALASMREEGVDAILVVDRGRLVGIFTERDALLKVAGRRPVGLTVGDVMTRDPVVLREDDTVAVAINKMAFGGFRHIPLVEHGRPTGIVTAQDVFHRISTIVG